MWNFLKTVNHKYADVNFLDATISCECSSEHRNLAVEKFQARLV
ncbi:hypothetical protein BH09BAC2_BH09BAC2_20530 [soil metagenome]